MTAGIRTVRNTLTRPGTTQPVAGVNITIRLNTVGFINSGTVEKVQQRYVTTDANGMWSADLEVNADIDPTGSYYTVRELTGSIWAFVVPTGDPAVPVQLRDCLVTNPTNPNPVITAASSVPPGGTTGQVLSKIDSTDFHTQWVAQTGGGGGGAVSSVAGKTGVVTLASTDLTDAASLATAAALTSEAAARNTGDGLAAQKSANLSDLASASTARTNLGLGTAATTAATAYDSAGAATAAQAAATAAAATDATTKANAAQAVAIQRANHTGTQSADTLTDGTTNKAYLATERTKLTGIAIGATATVVGTTSGTVAAGDDPRIVGAASAANLTAETTRATNAEAGKPSPRSVRREMISRRNILVSATPPTVTTSAAAAATSITGSALRQPQRVNTANNTATEPIDLANDVNFSYLGVGQGQYLWGFGNTKTAALTGTTSSKHWAFSVLSNVYCDQFEIVFVPANAVFSYRLRVDGQWVTEHATTLTGLTVGSTYRILVNFGAVGNHKVQIDMADNGFNGLALLPVHSTARVNEALDVPTVVAAADSVTAGTNTDGTAAGFCRIDSWLNYTAELMGWRDVRNGALASTGFVNAGTEVPFTSRLADIAVAGARVVVYGGLNDVASVATTLPAAIDTVFAAIVAAGPAEFIVMGCHPMNGNTYSTAGYINVNNLLKSKATQYGATFIDPFVIKWVTGTGNFTTHNNSGNADLFVNADNIHPTREGQKYLGRLYADAIATAYQTLQA